jgi:hypothetical protein
VAVQGERSPRMIVVGAATGSPAAAAATGAASSSVMCIARARPRVNRLSRPRSVVRPNRDLPAPSEPRSTGRHTGAVRQTASSVKLMRRSVTAREDEVDRHPIVALSAMSAEDSINPQYGTEGKARNGVVRLSGSIRGLQGYVPEIGEAMPRAVDIHAQPVAGADHMADAAAARPMTGVDAA